MATTANIPHLCIIYAAMDQEITHYAIHRNKEAQKWLHQTLAASFRVTFWRPIMKPHVLRHKCKEIQIQIRPPLNWWTLHPSLGCISPKDAGVGQVISRLNSRSKIVTMAACDIVHTQGLSSWDSHQNRVPKDVLRYLRKCSAFRPKPKQSLGAPAAWLDLKLKLKKLFKA